MTNNVLGNVFEDIFNQIMRFLMENNKTEEVKKKLIDPLIDYYKNKLFIFYGIITSLLIIVVLSNLYIIYKLHS